MRTLPKSPGPPPFHHPSTPPPPRCCTTQNVTTHFAGKEVDIKMILTLEGVHLEDTRGFALLRDALTSLVR